MFYIDKLKKNKGFSLLEVLIVVAILAIISAIGAGFYLNYGKGVELNSFASTVASDLRQAQSRSMIGEDTSKWGIHFVNASGSAHYYEIFSTPDNYTHAVILSKNYLPKGITFSVPISGWSKDIIFNKISGGMQSDSSVAIISGSTTKTISVSTVGTISIQ